MYFIIINLKLCQSKFNNTFYPLLLHFEVTNRYGTFTTFHYFSEDSDTVSYALDALCNIMNDTRIDMDPQELVNIPPDLGKQFTEIFVKDPENVQLVLSFLSVISCLSMRILQVFTHTCCLNYSPLDQILVL